MAYSCQYLSANCEMKTFVLILLGLSCARSAKILAVFHMASYSHFGPGQTLMNALVDQGHDVTMISPFNDPDSKFKLVQLTGFVDVMADILQQTNFFDAKEKHVISTVKKYHHFGSLLVEATLKHSNVRALLESDAKFDVVIIEQFYNEAFRGFCHHFNASCIVFMSLTNSYNINAITRNPEEPSYMTQHFLGSSNPMDFLTRLKNALSLAYESFYFHTVVIPEQETIARAHFKNAPSLRDLLYETDLILLNSHLSYADVKPLVPAVVEIGGFHVKPPGKLPDEFQKFLDGAKEGVVYFSMGSVLKWRNVPASTRKLFTNVFAKLNLKVLWKYDGDVHENVDNIRFEKWVPQKEVLAHPNVKLFITHGGMSSVIESIHNGVPIVGVPVFGDQEFNVRKCESSGVGVVVDYWNLNEDELLNAINTVLKDKTYSEMAKKKSLLMRDRPMKPLDTAIYWIEHIIRHKGGKHLRSPALDLQWYQYVHLDVVIFLITVATMMVAMLSFCFRKICYRRKANNVINEKKRK